MINNLQKRPLVNIWNSKYFINKLNTSPNFYHSNKKKYQVYQNGKYAQLKLWFKNW